MLHLVAQDQNPWWRGGAPPVAATPVRRDLQPVVLRRLLDLDDRRAGVILGPRQVGKTVLLRQTVADLIEAGWPPGNITYFDFSDDRLTGSVSPRDLQALRPVGADPRHVRLLLFDEIGRCPEWSRWLKQAVDTTFDRVVVTDSAASILRDPREESGAGRWIDYVMEPLSFTEYLRLQSAGSPSFADVVREPTHLLRYLETGGFPEHLKSDDFAGVRARLRSDIADKAILRDLLRFGVNVADVRNLFVYLIQGSGGIFDAAARARDMSVDPRSVRDWTRLLEDTLLVRRVNRHASAPSVRLRAKPKLYAADHGIVLAFEPRPDPMRDPLVRGRVFETIVFRHLREVATAAPETICYLRDKRSGDKGSSTREMEVDFIVTDTLGKIAMIEVTSSKKVEDGKIQNLRFSRETFAGAAPVLIYDGNISEHERKGVRCIPLISFLLDPKCVMPT